MARAILRLEKPISVIEVDVDVSNLEAIGFVRRNTGIWIDIDDCMAICSECDALGCGSNFCPNCGADMR